MVKWLALSLMIFSAAAARSAEVKVRAFHGELQVGGHLVAAALGEDGAWLVESKERWDGLIGQMKTLGVKIDDELGEVDFAKENLACIFRYGDEGDQFLLKEARGDEKARQVDLAMSYIIYKGQRALRMGVWKVFAVPVAKAAETKVTLSTFHPLNGGPNPTIDKAKLEWEWTFSSKTGEAIGGLTAAIHPQAKTIKPGEDIQIQFTLALADAQKEKNGVFANPREVIHVWDGKYSNGYRNYGFIAQTPGGKMVELRPKRISDWDKNAPHPVEIKTGKSYILPGWREGDELKSLKALGLDTSVPGTYQITGIYQEQAEPIGNDHPAMWGGIVRTNTITIEIK